MILPCFSRQIRQFSRRSIHIVLIFSNPLMRAKAMRKGLSCIEGVAKLASYHLHGRAEVTAIFPLGIWVHVLYSGGSLE